MERRKPFRLRISRVPAIACASVAMVIAATFTFPSESGPGDDPILRQILAGDFDALRSVEVESDRGVPSAMFWQAAMLEACVFERCDGDAAKVLYLRAARAGDGRAIANVVAASRTRAELDEITARIGVPQSGIERVVYAMVLAEFARESGSPDDSARTTFRAIATAERQLGLLAVLVQLDGPFRLKAELDALVEAGHPDMSRKLLQYDMINGDFSLGTPGRGLVARARAGSLGVAASYCIGASETTGNPVLPDEMRELCERAAKAGYPAAVRALLGHHHARGNRRAADYFIGLCESLLGMLCAGDIHAALADRRAESPDMAAREALWELASANMLVLWTGLGELSEKELRGSTEALRRGLFRLRVRTRLILEACLTARVDPATGATEPAPDCPWRKPVDIPEAYVGNVR